MRRDKDHEKLDAKKLDYINGGHTVSYRSGGYMRKTDSRQHYIDLMIYTAVFLVVFALSAGVRMRLLGSAPNKLLKVDWNEQTGTIYRDLSYGNHAYDLYIPAGLDTSEDQYLILFIHGGSFNSGSKEDGDAWCKFYASKGYIAATVDYTLQNHGRTATIDLMIEEMEDAVNSIKEKSASLGYHIAAMASSGVSAGGTLAMNLAYKGRSSIPVRFVFQLAAPTWFDPADWGLLKKVDKLVTDEEFISMMSACGDWKTISPAWIVQSGSVPTLMGYGLIDHCVPLDQKHILMEAMDAVGEEYDYIPFPHSNHGMYNDLDKMQEFIDMSLLYCERFFSQEHGI